MLQHEVMAADEWHDIGPQDLVMVSLCIQTAINKMHLCSFSIAYACPYHNPTAIMGHFYQFLQKFFGKTAHFRVAFYCDEPKAHLCTNRVV